MNRALQLPHLLLLGCLLAALRIDIARAQNQPLVADLSSHVIAVTTGFVGTDLLLFGATDGEGRPDVVVVVRGPSEQVIVRRKERVGGIWINRDQVEFVGPPAFYQLASSRPLQEIADTAVLARHQIGVEHLKYANPGAKHADDPDFRKALVRNKQRQGLYASGSSKVSFLGNRLFRTDVHFPSNVPTGTFSVTVYLMRDGHVESAQTTPLVVSRAGIGAAIYEFAHRYAAIHGLIAVLLALFSGWLAGALFKRA